MDELEDVSSARSGRGLASRFTCFFAREATVAESKDSWNKRDLASNIMNAHCPNAMIIKVTQTPMPKACHRRGGDGADLESWI